MKRNFVRMTALVALMGFGSAGLANAATVTYTSSAAYFAAAGPQSLQNFNSPISSSLGSTTYGEITFGDVVVSCAWNDWCNSLHT